MSEAWETTRKEWVMRQIMASEYAAEYAADRGAMAAKTFSLNSRWIEELRQRAKTHRLPTQVLDEVYRLYGLAGIREFRGIYEAGAAGYEPPCLRIWDKSLSTVRKMAKSGAMGVITGSVRQMHRSSVERAWQAGEDVPRHVLDAYPDIWHGRTRNEQHRMATNQHRAARQKHPAGRRCATGLS